MVTSNDPKVFTAQYAEDGGWRNWAYSATARRLAPGPVHASEDEAKAALASEEKQLTEKASAA